MNNVSVLGVAEENKPKVTTGTSVFDPVLCELMYRWFVPLGGSILDPFAGGSVRGIVAAMLGRAYTGVDLRQEQIVANQGQARDILTDGQIQPRWIVGDSVEIATLAPGCYDFIFSCPPYADLEVYSDDARDLSNMHYEDFKSAYFNIIKAACSLLKPDRFACFVVGDARDKKGFYYGLPWHTVQAFEAAGLRLYNEAVLLTMIGSLPVRVGYQFNQSRKLGKAHQNILIFCKGDPRRATDAIGPVECGDIEIDE